MLEPVQPSHRRKITPLVAAASATFVFPAALLYAAGFSAGDSVTVGAVLVAVVFSLYSLRFAWICFSASLTMSGMSHQFLGLGILPEQLFLLIFVAHAVRKALKDGKIPKDRKPPRLSMILASLLIGSWLLILTSFSAFTAPLPEQSLRLVIWVVVNVLSVFIIRYLATSPDRLVRDGLITTTSMTVLFIIGWLLANLAHSGNIFVEADYASSTYRLKGLMLEPNLLASLSLMWLCVSYAFRNKISPRTYWVSFTILSFGIFVTYTRAAWIILILLGAASVWNMSSKYRGLAVALLIAVIPIAFLALFSADGSSSGSISGTIQARFDSLLDFDSGTGAYRARTWQLAWQDVMRDGLWSGHGYNSFSQTHFSNETSNGTLYLGLLWLSLIYDGGLLAFLAFVVALLLVWRAAGRRSSWFFAALIILSTSTNPTWFMFPWALAALLTSKYGSRQFPHSTI